MGDDPRPTGVWFEPLETRYYAFVDAGGEVDIASIAGRRITADPRFFSSKAGTPRSVERFIKVCDS